MIKRDGQRIQYLRKLQLIYLVIPVYFNCCAPKEETWEIRPIEFELFAKVDSKESGVRFKNMLKEELDKGISRFTFDYFYNGAGVGVCDLNNDGLEDLFFTGNQVDNRLYINQGNLQFKDVSTQAKINQNKGWATGVTFADVNSDGWMDIYVSQGGPLGSDRSNRLYINQKNLTFTEEAAAYGLDYKGLTTQSVFFDYDKDGDLDCLVTNEHPLYGFSAKEFQYHLKKQPDLLFASSCHLFKFEKNRYINFTEQAGLLTPAFALGVVVSDINHDGWLDFYISNDYYIPDALYINQRDGTFKDEVKQRTNQVTYAGMGVDISDFNNDGNYDIFTLDMASPDHVRSKLLMAPMNEKFFGYLVNELDYHYAYMFNTMQLGLGNGTFQNIAHQLGLAKTDWSWTGLLADLDNDTDKDIIVTNGTEFTLDNDFHAKVQAVYAQYPPPNEIPIQKLKDLHAQIPYEKLPNLLFENQGSLTFRNVSLNWGFQEPTFSNGAAYADLDNDGDLDVVISNNNHEVSLYRNLLREKSGRNYLRVKAQGNLSESFPKVYLKYGGEQQMIEISRVRGYLSSVENIAHFGMGNFKSVDTVRIQWPSGRFQEHYNVKTNQVVTFMEKEAKNYVPPKQSTPTYFAPVEPATIGLNYRHHESKYNDFTIETLLPYKQSTLGPFFSTGDMNGDGEEDIFVSGPKGQPGSLYIKTLTGFEHRHSQALIVDKMLEDMESLIFDFDNDGDNDLLVITGSNEYEQGAGEYSDRMYINDGKGNLTRQKNTIFDQFKHSGRSVACLDYDKDGDNDLIIGNRMVPGMYPRPSPSFIYNNNGGELKDVSATIAPDLQSFGAINKIIPTDFNNDGWMDFIALGEWTHIGMFKNNQGTFTDISSQAGLDKYKGWWFTVAETDINNDGFKDYVIGNLGLNCKYKASMEKPLKIYTGDFDNNGTHDMMLSYEYEGQYVPLRGRECSSGQIPMLAEKFPTYFSFANASIDDLFGVDLVNSSYQKEATVFQSLLLLNHDGRSFEVTSLPAEAQLFPVMACIFRDVNRDGFEDVILAGGIHNTEVETPRLAGMGQLLLSDGGKGYVPVPWQKSGLYMEGNIKSLAWATGADNVHYLIAGINDGALKVFSLKNDDL